MAILKRHVATKQQAQFIATKEAILEGQKRVKAFRAAATKAKISPNARKAFLSFEAKQWAKGFQVVAGTDEAGRGPLAGPVVAAAFALLKEDDVEVLQLMASVKDSKQMSIQQREEAFKELTDPKYKGRVAWAIAEASVQEISKANILQAALAAMERSIRKMSKSPDCVLVDGCNRIPGLLGPNDTWTRASQTVAALRETMPPLDAHPKAVWKPNSVQAVIKGDALVPSIAAASVLAKVHRDRLMDELHEKYPIYGFDSHRGYGTASHIKVLKKIGFSPVHRTSFAPVNELRPAKASAFKVARAAAKIVARKGKDEGKPAAASAKRMPVIKLTTKAKAKAKAKATATATATAKTEKKPKAATKAAAPSPLEKEGDQEAQAEEESEVADSEKNREVAVAATAAAAVECGSSPREQPEQDNSVLTEAADQEGKAATAEGAGAAAEPENSAAEALAADAGASSSSPGPPELTEEEKKTDAAIRRAGSFKSMKRAELVALATAQLSIEPRHARSATVATLRQWLEDADLSK